MSGNAVDREGIPLGDRPVPNTRAAKGKGVDDELYS